MPTDAEWRRLIKGNFQKTWDLLDTTYVDMMKLLLKKGLQETSKSMCKKLYWCII